MPVVQHLEGNTSVCIVGAEFLIAQYMESEFVWRLNQLQEL